MNGSMPFIMPSSALSWLFLGGPCISTPSPEICKSVICLSNNFNPQNMSDSLNSNLPQGLESEEEEMLDGQCN